MVLCCSWKACLLPVLGVLMSQAAIVLPGLKGVPPLLPDKKHRQQFALVQRTVFMRCRLILLHWENRASPKVETWCSEMVPLVSMETVMFGWLTASANLVRFGKSS